MSPSVDQLLPPAETFLKKVALAEAEEAAKVKSRQDKAEAEKRALLAQLQKPSGVSDELRIKRAVAIIQRAVSAGKCEVQIVRFPNTLCTDRGRTINQQEEGWEKTLTGVPKELYDTWDKYFRPRGYSLHAKIIDFPGGMPGDVVMTLSWAQE